MALWHMAPVASDAITWGVVVGEGGLAASGYVHC
jgi:hypothetical protein